MRLAAWLLAAMGLALAAASPAGAAWKRQLVAKDGVYDTAPALAGNERGDAALVFRRGNAVYVAIARPSGDLGRARKIPAADFGDPIPGSDFGNPNGLRVAVDERGNTLVGWTYNDGSAPPRPSSRDEGCCRRIQLTLLRHGSTRFVASKTMGRPGVDSYLEGIAIVDGRVGVAWDDYYGTNAKFSRRGLQLGAPARIAGASALAVMPLAAGPVLTFLSTSNYGPDFSVDWRIAELRGARSTTTRTLFARHSQYPHAAVAANARGQQTLAWTEEVGSRAYDVYAAFRGPADTFRPHILSRRGSYDDPVVALASTGAAVVGWDNSRRIFAAGRRPGGAFGGVAKFPPRSYVYSPQVAVNRSGRGLVAWQALGSHDRQFVAFRSRGGRRIGLKDIGRTTWTARGVVLDSHGIARIAWMLDNRMYAARGKFPAK
jgi:hypothetical protein